MKNLFVLLHYNLLIIMGCESSQEDRNRQEEWLAIDVKQLLTVDPGLKNFISIAQCDLSRTALPSWTHGHYFEFFRRLHCVTLLVGSREQQAAWIIESKHSDWIFKIYTPWIEEYFQNSIINCPEITPSRIMTAVAKINPYYMWRINRFNGSLITNPDFILDVDKTFGYFHDICLKHLKQLERENEIQTLLRKEPMAPLTF